jgi:hypothetical protein
MLNRLVTIKIGDFMKLLNEAIVMDYFVKLMDEGKINFLNGGKALVETRKAIKKHINNIKKLSPESIHEKIIQVRDLWKILFEAAMVYIDPDKQGYDNLFKYFDAFVEFEELIFASDKYYRDHTLHSMWVYFLGEYLYHNPEFKSMLTDFNISFRRYEKIREYFSKLESKDLFYDFLLMLNDVNEILEYDDAIRCVTALAHDLGYPLERIKNINESIKNILPYFHITRFGAFSFQFDNVQQFYIENLLDLISCDIDYTVRLGDMTYDEEELIREQINYIVRISQLLNRFEDPPSDLTENFEKSLENLNTQGKYIIRKVFRGITKLTKDISKVMRFGNDFENYRHGIMSSYLVTKQLNSFSNIQIKYSDQTELEQSGINIPKVYAKLRILEAMSDHKSPGYKMRAIDTYSSLLLLVDEIEEFSRISRANQYRQFVNEFCKTKMGFDDGIFCIDFIFDDKTVAGLDPQRNFIDKAKTFMKIFDIPNLQEDFKVRIRCIDELTDTRKIYEFAMSKNCFQLILPEGCFKPGTPKKLQTTSNYLNTKEVFENCKLKIVKAVKK